MKTEDSEDEEPFLSKEEEQLLGKIVRASMRPLPSASSRTRCPDPEIIRRIAFHEKIDRRVLERALLHIPECGQCARIAEKHVGEYREQKAREKTQIID